MPSKRIVTLSLLFACQGLQILGFGALALFLPLIRRDLELTYTQAGGLFASSTFVYAFMQIPAGYLADRYGPRRIALAGFAGTAFATVSVAVVSDYGMLLGIMVVYGFFRGLVFTPGLVLVSGWFAPQRRGTSMGGFIAVVMSFYALLALVGPSLVAVVGWRPLFVSIGVVGIGTAVLFDRLGSDPPSTEPAAPIGPMEPLRLFRDRIMWLLGAIQFIRLAVALGIHYWLPTFLVDDAGLSLQSAGVVIALAAVLAAPSNLLGGYVSDRTARPVLVICASLGMLAMTLLLLAMVENLVLTVAVIAVNAVFLQFYFGPLFAIPVEVLGRRMAGTASGFGNFFANLGSFTFAFALGAVKDASGSFAWGFCALGALAGQQQAEPAARRR